MSNDVVELLVNIDPEADADLAELEGLTNLLREELDSLDDIASVERTAAEEAPEGAKVAGGFAVGSLVVKLAPSLIGAAARVVQRWLLRSAVRGVEISINGNSIKLTNASEQDQERLISLLEGRYTNEERTEPTTE